MVLSKRVAWGLACLLAALAPMPAGARGGSPSERVVVDGPADHRGVDADPQACCFHDGSGCVDVNSHTCVHGHQGHPQGFGSRCATTSCPPAVACCYSHGSDRGCLEVTAEFCWVPVGGLALGEGSSCATDACPMPCCVPGHDCLVFLPDLCSALGGVLLEAEHCGVEPCPVVELGACCLVSGACVTRYERECLDSGGTWHGPFVGCGSVSCGQSQACCLADDSCVELLPEDCAAAGGMSQGLGSACAGTSCDSAQPGAVPSGTAARPGAALTLLLVDGGELALGWSASCSASAVDYAVHEGVLGDWYSHEAVLCTTGGLFEATFAPAPGDRYYLVVPVSVDDEGSAGLTSDGEERGSTGSTCVERRRLGCP
ncbi:MAG: hypothetical protein AAF533_15055 [Acidobacteriota bacterium]